MERHVLERRGSIGLSPWLIAVIIFAVFGFMYVALYVSFEMATFYVVANTILYWFKKDDPEAWHIHKEELGKQILMVAIPSYMTLLVVGSLISRSIGLQIIPFLSVSAEDVLIVTQTIGSLVGFICAQTWVGFVESAVFQGLTIDLVYYKPEYKNLWILLMAVAFASFHAGSHYGAPDPFTGLVIAFSNFPANIGPYIYTIIAGVIFNYLAVETENILGVWIGHTAHNLSAIF